MAFCAQCGTETQGSFCAACGARVGAGPVPAGPGVTPSAAPLDEHIVSALCYLVWPLTGILFLVVEPYNRSRVVRFHAFQSIFVFAALFATFGALSVLAFLPIVGLLFSLVTLVFPVCAFGLWIFLMIKAYNKERFEVPVLGQLAEKQA